MLLFRFIARQQGRADLVVYVRGAVGQQFPATTRLSEFEGAVRRRAASLHAAQRFSDHGWQIDGGLVNGTVLVGPEGECQHCAILGWGGHVLQ